MNHLKFLTIKERLIYIHIRRCSYLRNKINSYSSETLILYYLSVKNRFSIRATQN